MAVQTFGDFLFWHPHVHVIATAGVFDADGIFHLAPIASQPFPDDDFVQPDAVEAV